MNGGCRGRVLCIALGLLCCVRAAGQTVDSVAARQDGDTAAGAPIEPVVLRTIADSVVGDWKSDRGYAYANDSDYWKWRDDPERMRSSGRRTGPVTRFVGSRLFEYLILFLLGAILLYAIVRIIVANRLQLFYRSPKRLLVAKKAEDGTPEEDLDGKLTHFIQTKDYRQAVRYLYLKALRLLNDRELIRYHHESTNHEYWQQLKATPQGGPFRDLTAIYEKVWYGEFPLGDVLFERLHGYFSDFYKTIRA